MPEEMVEIFSVDCGLNARAEQRAEERREAHRAALRTPSPNPNPNPNPNPVPDQARTAQLYFEDEGFHPPLIRP